MAGLPGRRVVLGLGNPLRRDEGVGVHAVLALRQRLGEDSGVECLDGGVLGLNLLPIVEESSYLLLLDAVDAGVLPGSLVELSGPDIHLYSQFKLSLHQTTFQEVLALAQLRGKLPARLYLIGLEPRDLSVGTALTEPIQRALPKMVARAEEVLAEWGLLAKQSPG
jgi:hydrogenase maturation protease